SEGVGVAAALHLLEVSGVVAFGGSAATAAGTAEDARTGLGGGQPAVDLHHVGHRYYRAHALWPTDGRSEKLQPEEQGQEELSAHPYLSGGNPRIHLGRVAQWRSADGPADRAPSGECFRRSPAVHRKDLRPGGCWFLLSGWIWPRPTVQRTRLWASTAQASQAALAKNWPDGQCSSPAPSLRSRMASSTLAWSRWNWSISMVSVSRLVTKA